MKKILIAIIALCSFTLNSQAQDFVRELDQKTQKPLLRGQITFDDIANESTCSWIKDEYSPNETDVYKISKLLPKYRLVIFLGTWCEDTQYLMPQLLQTLKNANFDFNALEMYGVNRAKEGLNAEHLIYNIERVPSIIVMDRFKEVGRIVESTKESIEKELLNILEADQ
jgi:thiol-disulfide isomerase/thioredoxin